MGKPRALIIGGSLAGLFTGNLLRTIGWDVAIFERSRDDLTGRGAGLGMQAGLFQVMRGIGIELDDSMSATVRSHICLDRMGKTLCEIPMPGSTTAWDRVYCALKRAFPVQSYHSGMTLKRIEQSKETVAAIFADGSRTEGDLLVGADGVNSTVRRQFLPKLDPAYAGYVAWRGVIDEEQVRPALRELAFQDTVFGFPEGEMAVSIPMAARDGKSGDRRRRCMFVWFRPADYQTALPRLCTDASGRAHGVSIPPPLIRPELVDDLKHNGETLLAPQLAHILAGLKQPILQPIFDLKSPRLVFGRVVLVGDAAFVARPHVGTGVTKAALDAQELVDQLATLNGDMTTALDRYDSKRRVFGNRLVARGRYLGSHLEPTATQNKQRQPAQGIAAYLREFGPNGVIEEGAIDRHACGHGAEPGRKPNAGL